MRPDVLSYQAAIRSGDALVRLKAHALGAVAAVVPAAVAALLDVTRRRAVDGAIVLEGQPGAGLGERFVAECPVPDPFAPGLVAASGASVVALDDLADGAAAYRWHLRTIGFGDRAAMYLRSAGTIVAAISLGRSLHQPPFGKDETRALRRIHPLIERAFVPAAGPRGAMLPGDGLSAREREVAELVARGATNAEIARSLHVSEATVKTHLSHIYVKTGVNSRTRLALLLGNRVPAAADG